MVAQKRPDRPWKTWNKVLVNDRKKVKILLTLIFILIGEDTFEEDLSNKPNPR